MAGDVPRSKPPVWYRLTAIAVAGAGLVVVYLLLPVWAVWIWYAVALFVEGSVRQRYWPQPVAEKDEASTVRATVVRRLPGADRVEIETADGTRHQASVGFGVAGFGRSGLEAGSDVEARVWSRSRGARVIRVAPRADGHA